VLTAQMDWRHGRTMTDRAGLAGGWFYGQGVDELTAWGWIHT
jgi:hypothetical protein